MTDQAEHDRKLMKTAERIRRACLRCDRTFLAYGRYNRICATCARALNWYVVTDKRTSVRGDR